MSDLETAARDVLKTYGRHSSGQIAVEMAVPITALALALENHKPNAVPDSHRALIEHCCKPVNSLSRSDLESWVFEAQNKAENAEADLPNTFKHHCVRAGCTNIPDCIEVASSAVASGVAHEISCDCGLNTGAHTAPCLAWATWYGDQDWNTRGES